MGYYRKIAEKIEKHLISDDSRILMVDGARQIGKTYIIREVGLKNYKYFVEINLLEDSNSQRLFSNVHSLDEFYFQLSVAAEGKLGDKNDTLVFLDEIQVYPGLITLLKFLREDDRYTYIASGSMLGIALRKTVSIPMGSILEMKMYPMDFEEFVYANGIDRDVIDKLHTCFMKRETVPQGVHDKMLTLFKYYLICGGLPDAVKAFVERKNIIEMRQVQMETHEYYSIDASQYGSENKLKIRAVYDAVPSLMENVKKRVVVNAIENKKGKTFESYHDEFEYLTSSGICHAVKAVPTPVFPLTQGLQKNLIKLYMNDSGILTALLYGSNINAIINDNVSVNLGSVYETAVATELQAHGFNLFYYDNRKKGEVDFLIDDYDNLSVLPMEIKSGKNYTTHAALNRFLSNEDYSTKRAFVFSNAREMIYDGGVEYFPIYMIMFVENQSINDTLIQPIGKIEF